VKGANIWCMRGHILPSVEAAGLWSTAAVVSGHFWASRNTHVRRMTGGSSAPTQECNDSRISSDPLKRAAFLVRVAANVRIARLVVNKNRCHRVENFGIKSGNTVDGLDSECFWCTTCFCSRGSRHHCRRTSGSVVRVFIPKTSIRQQIHTTFDDVKVANPTNKQTWQWREKKKGEKGHGTQYKVTTSGWGMTLKYSTHRPKRRGCPHTFGWV